MSSTAIHTSSSQGDNAVSDNAAESTFHEVDDQDRAIPAIEFRNVVLSSEQSELQSNEG